MVFKVSAEHFPATTVCTYYKPPKDRLNPSFISWLATMENLILMGDLNAKHKDFHSVSPSNHCGRALAAAINNETRPLNLICLNDGTPTKIARKMGKVMKF